MSSTITIPSPPNTTTVAANILSYMAAQSGVVTDYNIGSQIRTNSEAIGSVEELQGISAQAQAFQAMVYSAYSAFGIYPLTAQPATGTITFLTGTGSNPPPASQAVLIPAGTIVATIGGTQFNTTQAVTLLQNSTSISAPIVAVAGGTSGNTSANTITQIVTGLPYALFCTNYAATTGGQNAESASQTLARFTAAVAAIGLGTPVAIANSAIGVTVSGTGETVKYSSVYEPWITQVQNNQTVVPGFDLFIDNGSGSASNTLLSLVTAKLNGVVGSLDALGNRPAGVPYVVSGVTPLYSSVVVSGTIIDGSSSTVLTNSAVSAINTYYASVGFASTISQSQLTAAVANSVSPSISSLSVVLINASGVSVSGITASYNERNILQSSTVNFT